MSLPRPGHLRARIPALVVATVHAAAQSQYAFVVPWMVVAHGGSAASAVLSVAIGYLPYLVMSPLAAILGDRVEPRRLLVGALVLAIAATVAYPLQAAFTTPSFAVVYAASAAFGAGRPFVDAGVFRAIAALDRDEVMRAQSARSVLMQAAGFGAPAFGLLLFHLGGADWVCYGIAAMLAVGLVFALVPARPHGLRPETSRVSVRESFSSVSRTPTLLRIAIGVAAWNLVAGAAFSLVSPVLDQAGFSSNGAALTFLGGGVAVVALTYPLVHAGLIRLRVGVLFAVAVAFEGGAFLVFSDVSGVWLCLLYVAFLVSNSVAASASNGARALASRPHEQALLGVGVTAVSTATYFFGVTVTALALHVLALRTVAAGVALLMLGLGLGVASRPPVRATPSTSG